MGGDKNMDGVVGHLKLDAGNGSELTHQGLFDVDLWLEQIVEGRQARQRRVISARRRLHSVLLRPRVLDGFRLQRGVPAAYLMSSGGDLPHLFRLRRGRCRVFSRGGELADFVEFGQ